MMAFSSTVLLIRTAHSLLMVEGYLIQEDECPMQSARSRSKSYTNVSTLNSLLRV